MNKNETTDIATLPSIAGSRNKFTYIKKHATTFNVGEIVPIYFNMLVEPGDTIMMDMASIIRTTTLLFPPFDNLICEIFWFKQDWLNLYDHTRELMGENRTGSWYQQIEYALPSIVIPANTKLDTHTIAAHMACPIQAGNYKFNKMAVDMYNDVCNEWFNNQTVMPPVVFSTGDSDVTYDGTSLTGGTLRKAAKLFDYFTAGLPEPQKASGMVSIPIADEVPVYGNGKALGLTDGTNSGGLANRGGGAYLSSLMASNFLGADNGTATPTYTGTTQLATGVVTSGESGLIADMTAATAIAFNALRTAAVQQQIYEGDAYWGTRAREIIKSRWGVNTTADTLHIPEYLGGTRFELENYQIAQTSETSGSNYQGDLAGYSETGNIHHCFTKSFDFWGCIMGLVVVRQEHTYAQGLPRQFSMKRRFDFHWPEMEHLGFVPTYNKEIYITGTEADDNGVFNYRPIFQEYRYERSEVTGEFNPSYSQSLDYMLYVDDYDASDGSLGQAPVFGANWMEENPDFVDRTLVYDHTQVDQIQMVNKFRIIKISKLSQYGLPGLTRF